MNRQDFKDQLTVALIPMYTQMLVTVEQAPQIAGAQEQKAKATLPPAEQVAALALGFAEKCAQIRDAHIEGVKEARKQTTAKKAGEPLMKVTRAANYGGDARDRQDSG